MLVYLANRPEEGIFNMTLYQFFRHSMRKKVVPVLKTFVKVLLPAPIGNICSQHKKHC